MASKHDGFSLSVSGFVVNPAWPFLGAFPDSVISCTCCGDGALEIKGPFLCRE